MDKYSKWLKRWLLGGWFIYAAMAAIMLAMVLVPSVRGQVAQWVGDRLAPETSAVYQPVDVGFEVPVQKTAQDAVSEDKLPDEKGVKPQELGTEQVKPEQLEKFTVTELAVPVNGTIIKGYGRGFSEIYQDYRFHDGVDFAAEPGSQVHAALQGRVADITEDPYRGLTVTIEHSSDWITIYSGLKHVQVKEGQSVKVGDVIGTVSSETGDKKENIVHFTLSHNSEPVNPVPYFNFN